MRMVILADGSSIHTEKWIQGLIINGETNIYLISMSANDTRAGIIKNINISNVFHLNNKVVKESGNNFSYILKIYHIYKILKKIKPEHISTIYLTSYGLIGSILKGKACLSHFLVGTDLMVTPEKSYFHLLLTKYALRKANLLVCASKSIEAKVSKLISLSNKKVITQQYGVDDFVITYPKQNKKYDFVSNRAWVENSNIIYILDIFKDVENTVKIVLIGSGGQQENEIYSKIKKLENAQGLGCLPYEDNIDLVAKSRFFLSLTMSDGASLSLLEAMAVGAIPIVSNIEPNKEWIVDGYNGFFIKLNDIDAAVRKIKKILTVSKEELSIMAERNIHIVNDKACLRTNMKKYLDFVYSVCSAV